MSTQTATPVKPAQGAIAKASDITDSVLAKVTAFQEAGELQLPANYSAGNALKSAMLILQETKDRDNKPVLQSCTQASIASALLDMVVQGLSPMKKQCAFIAYGNKLLCQREYHGTVALAKRFGGVKEVTGNCIYEGDEFEYEISPKTGRVTILKHNQKFENIDLNKIKGAYATLILEDGTTYSEVMSMAQIRQAWMQGQTKGQSPAHKNFPDEMAKKTVIGRACKLFISTSDDGAIMDDTLKDQPEAEEANERRPKPEVSFDDAEVLSETPNTPDPEPAPAQEAQTAQAATNLPGF